MTVGDDRGEAGLKRRKLDPDAAGSSITHETQAEQYEAQVAQKPRVEAPDWMKKLKAKSD